MSGHSSGYSSSYGRGPGGDYGYASGHGSHDSHGSHGGQGGHSSSSGHRGRGRAPSPQPNPVLVCLSPPPAHLVSRDDFVTFFRNEPGFVEVRFRKFAAFIEFRDTATSQEAMKRMHGRKLHPDAPPIYLHYDRDPNAKFTEGVKRKRSPSPRRGRDSRERSGRFRSTSPPERPPEKRARSRSPPSRSPTPARSPSPPRDVRPIRGPLSAPRYGPEGGRLHVDALEWLRLIVPFWEKTGFIPAQEQSRLTQAELVPVTRASRALKIDRLPEDVTARELSLLLSFTPNFVEVHLEPGNDGPMATATFTDVISSHIALVALQGFPLDGRPLHVDYAPLQ